MLRLTRDRIAEQQGGYPPKRFVLYVDQGEELYTRAPMRHDDPVIGALFSRDETHRDKPSPRAAARLV